MGGELPGLVPAYRFDYLAVMPPDKCSLHIGIPYPKAGLGYAYC